MNKSINLKAKSIGQLIVRAIVIDCLFCANLIVFSLYIGSMPQDVFIGVDSALVALYIVAMIPLFLVLFASSFFSVKIIDSSANRQFYFFGIVYLAFKIFFTILTLLTTAYVALLPRSILLIVLAVVFVIFQVLLLVNKKKDGQCYYIDSCKVYINSNVANNSDNTNFKKLKYKNVVVTICSLVFVLILLMPNIWQPTGLYWIVFGYKVDVVFTIVSYLLVLTHGIITCFLLLKLKIKLLKLIVLIIATIFYIVLHPFITDVAIYSICILMYSLLMSYTLSDLKKLWFN